MRLKKDTYIKLRAKYKIKEFYTLIKRLLSSSTSYIICPLLSMELTLSQWGGLSTQKI